MASAHTHVPWDGAREFLVKVIELQLHMPPTPTGGPSLPLHPTAGGGGSAVSERAPGRSESEAWRAADLPREPRRSVQRVAE